MERFSVQQEKEIAYMITQYAVAYQQGFYLEILKSSRAPAAVQKEAAINLRKRTTELRTLIPEGVKTNIGGDITLGALESLAINTLLELE